ncbi:MAG: hypothetical protein KF787_10395 [Phycisphaeraceae bacterium]|nr:hypothetical protein [Phycisphaerae bacterium]MBX3393044.1 hypothetical protein [Phycisphaeraceae bacterium]
MTGASDAISVESGAGVQRAVAATGLRADRGLEFAAVLGRHGIGATGREARPGSAGAARRAAEEFVSIALVQPVLAQARESSMAAEPFAPSPAERQFGALHDAMIAQRITRSAQFPLVDRIAESLMGRRVAGGVPAR